MFVELFFPFLSLGSDLFLSLAQRVGGGMAGNGYGHVAGWVTWGWICCCFFGFISIFLLLVL